MFSSKSRCQKNNVPGPSVSGCYGCYFQMHYALGLLSLPASDQRTVLGFSLPSLANSKGAHATIER